MWLLLLGILAVFGIAFIYSNLGQGGGVLFVPLLLALTAYSEDTVVAMSLFLVLSNCVMAIWNHHRKELIDWKLAGTMTSGAIIGTLLGVWFNKSTPKEPFLLLFLFVISMITIKMLMDWSKQSRICEMDNDEKKTKPRIAAASVGTIASGFVSGALGLGGGVISVPILIYVLGRCTKKAAGTSFVIMSISVLFGMAGYIASNTYIDWTYVMILSPVVLLGSFVGSRWGIKKLKGRHVQILFIMILLLAITKSLYDLWVLY